MLTLHFDQPRQPSQREMLIVDVCARHATDSIEAAKGRQALREIHDALEQRVRQRTAELAQANAKFRAVFNQGLFAGFLNLDGTLIDVSQTSLALGGLNREDVIGKRYWETGWWSRSAEVQAWIQEGVAKAAAGLRFGGVTSYFGADGSVRFIDLLFLPILDQDGSVQFIVTKGLDVTDRRRIDDTLRAAEVLRKSEEQFRQIADHAPVLMWVNDREGCEFVNREYLRFVGRTMTDVLGTKWQDFVHPDDLSAYVDGYQQALRDQEPFDAEMRFRSADGTYRWLHSTGVPRFDANGEFAGYVGCSVDITDMVNSQLDLKRAKEAAESANRAKDVFLAVLSHELRTPLTPVLMAIAELENNPDLPGMVRQDLAMVHRNVEIESKLIDDLLDISRITSGKLKLQCQPVDINAEVRHVCDTLRAQISNKGVRLTCTLDDQAGEVTADPARLHQVLSNILKNAAKFTPEDGRISVVTAAAGGAVRVQVRDTGIGVEPDVLPRVFEAFQQGSGGITRQFGGLGLGLTICKAIIDGHRGSIRMESDGPGRGACVTIELPRREATLREAPSDRDESPMTAPELLRVLVVEDHADTADLLGRMLAMCSYQVKVASSVGAALELVDREPFDLIISDLGLPDQSGYDLMRQIRQRHAMPGIAMSGFGMDDDIRKSYEAGFCEHLVKPVDFECLDQCIRRVVNSA